MVLGCGGMNGLSLGSYAGSLLGIRPGANIGFGDTTIVVM